LIGREIAENRSIEVHCHFDQEAVRLLPGTFMNAEVMVKNQQANVLPEEAILQYSNRKYVFVQTDSLHYSMREVQTGTTENGYTVVSGAGITPADQVVIKGSYTLLMMLKNKQED
jgi:cobalt-zinc-cadmium efflux system membrane fusion protein